MRRIVLGVGLAVGLLGASDAKAQNLVSPQSRMQYRNGILNQFGVPTTGGGGQTYNPNFGYSTPGMGFNAFGNSAPFQGNFSFPPGFGYGSIYGNGGHPGFHRFTGPSYMSPFAW